MVLKVIKEKLKYQTVSLHNKMSMLGLMYKKSSEESMQFNNSVNLAEILNRGFKNFKSTFKPFFKYAFLAVFVSYLIQVYVAVMDTFFLNHETLYIIGIIALVILFLPIAYFTIRLNMTAAGKLKAIIEGQPFNFKEKLTDSKHEFWRVFAVLAAKFAIKMIMFITLIPVFLWLATILSPVQEATPGLYAMVVPSLVVTIALFYLLTRLEFATLVIYWSVDTDHSDLNTSIRMTKNQYFKKLKLIIIAHIPSMILTLLMALNFFANYAEFNVMYRWIYILGVILFNTITLSWPMAFYYPLLKDMKAFKMIAGKVVDDEGQEWLTF